eukprot:CAMPEP_0179926822 /NCGR_PEP_ID=MMETSP0983-20121128/7986_1 /TAXON_ID=483367 /ORGANISM="non described non described, Strain CCMP 2436" /LENGTH=145 /DNA_ID=CAMNT_0021830479 /DNA_START=1561 /DNA_END=1997 /DNA_ORIENTATION=-
MTPQLSRASERRTEAEPVRGTLTNRHGFTERGACSSSNAAAAVMSEAAEALRRQSALHAESSGGHTNAGADGECGSAMSAAAAPLCATCAQQRAQARLAGPGTSLHLPVTERGGKRQEGSEQQAAGPARSVRPAPVHLPGMYKVQ